MVEVAARPRRSRRHGRRRRPVRLPSLRLASAWNRVWGGRRRREARGSRDNGIPSYSHPRTLPIGTKRPWIGPTHRHTRPLLVSLTPLVNGTMILRGRPGGVDEASSCTQGKTRSFGCIGANLSHICKNNFFCAKFIKITSCHTIINVR